MKKSLLLLALLLSPILLTACKTAQAPGPDKDKVTSFEECVAAGNPVMESYPRQCRHNGQTFTEITNESVEHDKNPDPEGACLAADNKWIPETSECEGMSREQCEKLGGTFNECASACRNDPEAEICTMQCVLVCQF